MDLLRMTFLDYVNLSEISHAYHSYLGASSLIMILGPREGIQLPLNKTTDRWKPSVIASDFQIMTQITLPIAIMPPKTKNET